MIFVDKCGWEIVSATKIEPLFLVSKNINSQSSARPALRIRAERLAEKFCNSKK